MPGETEQTWIQPFVQVVAELAGILPSLVETPQGHAELQLHSDRLKRLISTLPGARLEGQLPPEINALISEGIARLNTIVASLNVESLTVPTAGFGGFDELAFVKRARALPQTELIALARYVIQDPLRLTPFELVTRTAVLRQHGLPLAAIGRATVILFKLIALLILLLAVISFPALIPFAIVFAQVLAEIDKSGEKDKPAIPPGPPGGTTVAPSGTAEKLKLIGDKNARLKEMLENLKALKDAGADAESVGNMQDAIRELTKEIKDETKALHVPPGDAVAHGKKTYFLKHCDWVTLYPSDGDYHNWDLDFKGHVGSAPNPTIEIKLDGETISPLTFKDAKKSVTAKKCEIHLNANENDRAGVDVVFNW